MDYFDYDNINSPFNLVDSVIKWCWDHKIISLIIIGIAFSAYAINSRMYSDSITYEPLVSQSATLTENLNIPFNKSTGYSESVSIGSVLEGSVGLFSKSAGTLSDVRGVLSKAADASGKKGVLFIPAGASGAGAGDLQVYSWKKTYAQFFGQLPGTELQVVIVMGNSALSGKLSAFSTGVLSDVHIYYLN